MLFCSYPSDTCFPEQEKELKKMKPKMNKSKIMKGLGEDPQNKAGHHRGGKPELVQKKYD